MQIAVNLVRDSIRNRRLRFWNRTRAAAPDFDLASQSLPSLSWQEQLPPLNIPLTAIRPAPRPTSDSDPESQQQQ